MKSNLLKKLTGCIVACALVGTALAGCGGNGNDSSSADAAGDGQKVSGESAKYDTLNVGVIVTTVGIPAQYARTWDTLTRRGWM